MIFVYWLAWASTIAFLLALMCETTLTEWICQKLKIQISYKTWGRITGTMLFTGPALLILWIWWGWYAKGVIDGLA